MIVILYKLYFLSPYTETYPKQETFSILQFVKNFV